MDGAPRWVAHPAVALSSDETPQGPGIIIQEVMADTLSRDERSIRMALVRAKNTKPEMKVRSLVYGAGFRYRLHVSVLPGRPDLVFASRRKVIFVHGCFWHRHRAKGCRLGRLPKSRIDFWLPKLEGNRQRDIRNARKLRDAGWKVLQIWECELTNPDRLLNRVRRFLA
jgi:DNA mismatch endonuclease (patch repair protein)